MAVPVVRVGASMMWKGCQPNIARPLSSPAASTQPVAARVVIATAASFPLSSRDRVTGAT